MNLRKRLQLLIGKTCYTKKVERQRNKEKEGRRNKEDGVVCINNSAILQFIRTLLSDCNFGRSKIAFVAKAIRKRK